jgi:alpha-glucoside transport system substrate-binding protein
MKTWQKTSLAIALAAATATTAFAAGHASPSRGSGAYSWDSLSAFDNLDLSGVTITVSGPWLAPEDDYLRRVFMPFEQATGATVKYNGSDSFEQQILIDAQAGTPPNIAFFPQPGLAADMASRGYLTPVSNDVKQTVLNNYAAGQSWVDLATYADKSGSDNFYGVFYRADVKSLVWYSPDNFDDYGYEVPESMEELFELTAQIAADGETPWCIGLGSGAATGWPATDWVEDFMLRTQPPAVYDEWVLTKCDSTTRALLKPLKNSARSPRLTNTSPVALKQWVPLTSVTAQKICSVSRLSVSCTVRRASFQHSSQKAPLWVKT